MKPESASRQPIVLLPACQMMLGREPFHVVGRDYAQAIRLAGAVPFVIPSAQPDELETLLAMADGVIEAFTFDGPGFSLCLQWHPEWRAANNPVSRRVFAAFGAACQAYRRQREALGA